MEKLEKNLRKQIRLRQLFKLLIYFNIAFLVGQFLYYPTDYGYIHMILFVMTVLFLDLYQYEYLNYRLDIAGQISYSLAALSLILVNKGQGVFLWFYYVLILAFTIYNVKIIWDMYQVFKHKALHKINEKSQKIFKKQNKFMLIFSVALIMLLAALTLMTLLNLIHIIM